MIPYHQSRDFYHCCFRMACLLVDCGVHRIEFDKLRILDFYFVFPKYSQKMTFPKHLRHSRNAFSYAPDHYEKIGDYTRIFAFMAEFQIHAIRSMIGIGLIAADSFASSGLVVIQMDKIDLLKKVADTNTERKCRWYQAIVRDLVTIKLIGKDGLKHRSGLMEYRYDII